MAAMEMLTTDSQIQCPHGGTASISPPMRNADADAGAEILVEGDEHSVVGCPFTIGQKYSPCVKIKWKAGASFVKSSSKKVLTKASVGLCYSGENAPQGKAMVVSTQRPGKAQ